MTRSGTEPRASTAAQVLAETAAGWGDTGHAAAVSDAGGAIVALVAGGPGAPALAAGGRFPALPAAASQPLPAGEQVHVWLAGHGVAQARLWAELLRRRLATPTACAASVRAMARSIAHSLGNPLAGLCLTLDLMGAAAGEGPDARYLHRAQHLAARLGEIKDLLSALGGAVRGLPAPHSTASLLAEVASELGLTPPYSLRCEVAPGAAQLWGHAPLLRHVCGQLVRNAVAAAPAGCHIVLRAVAAPAVVRIEVEDDGPGVPAGLRPQLFRTPVTDQPRAAGVGLLVAAIIVEQVHGGRLAMLPAATGAHFALDLPVPGAA